MVYKKYAEQAVRRLEVVYHPMSSMVLNWDVIVGIAVEIVTLSCCMSAIVLLLGSKYTYQGRAERRQYNRKYNQDYILLWRELLFL